MNEPLRGGTAAGTTPSPNLIAALRAELMRGAPFAAMHPAHVERFVMASELAYFAPGETLLGPADGVVRQLWLVRQGRVSRHRDAGASAADALYEAGELFPIDAALGAHAVTGTYRADEDCYCLRLPLAQVHALAAQSAPFAAFLHRRVLGLLEASESALQADHAAQALAEQSLETPLRELARRAPVGVSPATPLADALALMHAARVGSLLVLDDAGAVAGIVTRHDVLGRITLPQLPLATPIARVMSAPVRTLDAARTAQDAALLMSRHGLRHVPVTEAGRVIGMVSERDLFALQRLSIRQISSEIGHAAAPQLRELAGQIRRLARNLLGQGIRARQLTELVSHLNDRLTERLVELTAARHGLDLTQACWLAFGSEGRSEQTVATDQDNGLVLDPSQPAGERPRWLAFAREVNEALAACGYPLCKGGVMASNPASCLDAAAWAQRFADWMAHGAPQDLLNASIYFDLRPIAGRAALAQPLQAQVLRDAQRLPRFLHQLALNALARRPPLNWVGGIEPEDRDGRAVVDLKQHGSALFVDAARLYALAHGVPATSTRLRLEGAGRAMGVPPHESQAWIGAFEFVQSLRLRVQLDAASRGADDGSANLVEVAALDDLDRRTLKESLHIARRLQQRIELDYRR